jgi:hypothetical protein
MSLMYYDSENRIIECTNPICKTRFSVIVYIYSDKKCTKINNAKMIPLTGHTPYYCPCCGENLGKVEGQK